MGSIQTKFALAALVATMSMGCGDHRSNPGSEPLENFEPKVIYGEDDRLDLYNIDDGATLLLARATATMVRNQKLLFNPNNGTFDIESQVYGIKYRLCPNEPFWDQPIGPSCSGFLVNSTTVITAGHCVRTQASCESLSFVFDYAYHDSLDESPDKNIPSSQVYSCMKLVHSENQIGSTDFAVLTLDRPVLGRLPLNLNTAGSLAVGTDVFVIGNPVGLPTKVAGGARVREVRREFFKANLDTYGGNSGSAVFNAQTGLVEGLLVRGERDFVPSGDGCRISKQCADDACLGEEVTKISEVLPYLNLPQSETK